MSLVPSLPPRGTNIPPMVFFVWFSEKNQRIWHTALQLPLLSDLIPFIADKAFGIKLLSIGIIPL